MTDAPAKKRSPVALIVVLGVVVFCCVSTAGLGAIGYSGFQDYVIRAKTSEATSNLRNLFSLSAGYYEGEQFGAGLGAGSISTACTVSPAITSNAPGEQKSVLDWSREADSFSTLGFAIADPVYYQYEIVGGPGHCGHPPETPVYSLRAHGDLDGDGERSLFELAVSSTSDGTLERAPGVHRENELE